MMQLDAYQRPAIDSKELSSSSLQGGSEATEPPGAKGLEQVPVGSAQGETQYSNGKVLNTKEFFGPNGRSLNASGITQTRSPHRG